MTDYTTIPVGAEAVSDLQSIKDMTDAEIVSEERRLITLWNGMDREGSGSPGEWIIERLDEISTEKARCAALEEQKWT